MSTTNTLTAEQVVNDFADKFCRWPLPVSVCADHCATKQGAGRTGTNLLTFIEAKQLAEDIILPILRQYAAQECAKGEEILESIRSTAGEEIKKLKSIVTEYRAENEALATCIAKKDEAISSLLVTAAIHGASDAELNDSREAIALTPAAAVDHIAQLKAQLDDAQKEIARLKTMKGDGPWISYDARVKALDAELAEVPSVTTNNNK